MKICPKYKSAALRSITGTNLNVREMFHLLNNSTMKQMVQCDGPKCMDYPICSRRGGVAYGIRRIPPKL